jgi:hypothetical protein
MTKCQVADSNLTGLRTMTISSVFLVSGRALTTLVAALSALALPMSAQADSEWSGELKLEYRWFPEDSTGLTIPAGLPPQVVTAIQALLPGVDQQNLDRGHHQPSVVLRGEYYNSWDSGSQSFTFVPYLRVDGMDEERTHFDIREALWLRVFDTWELRAGIGQVFWGTAESNNLVDIINQTDFVDQFTGDEKLGQPMVRATFKRDWGNVDVLLLPLFRERPFPGEDGRLRPPIVFSNFFVDYESDAEDKHLDYAVRYSRSLGNLDFGIYYFNGTSRDPRIAFVPTPAPTPQVPGGLVVRYDLMQQFGLDASLLAGPWIFKLEALHRDSEFDTYKAAVVGAEYTFGALFGGALDINTFIEYSYDSRDGSEEGFSLSPAAVLQNDAFVGARFGLNDAYSSQVRLGLMTDVTDGSKALRVEASRRLSNKWAVKLVGQSFFDVDPDNVLSSLENDDYVEASVSYFFP